MLDVKDLRVKFKSTGKEALRGINFQMKPGERLGLVGESGSGKTVTAMAISGLIERHNVEISGKVLFNEKDLWELSRPALRAVQGREIGVVFQEPMTSLDPLMKIGAQVEETLVIHTKTSPEKRKSLALRALSEVGIHDPEGTYNKYPHQLSGGQRQRVMIAAAMIILPKLLICDEPTTALDVSVQAQILDLLLRMNQDYNVGVLLISHDLKVVRALCERVIVMYRGNIVEAGKTEEVFSNPQDEYTKRLIAAIPQRRRYEH